MPHTASWYGRGTGRVLLVVAGLGAALLAGCGGGSSTPTPPPPPVDLARLDVCVLTGQQVSNGCTTDTSGNPQIALGDMAMGDTKSVVVALYDGAGGDVAAVVSAVTLEPAGSTTNYSLSLFTVSGTTETPATLPFTLTQNHGTELRARVTFNAFAAIGPVSGVSLKVVMSHPVTQQSIPVVGNITGCPTGKGDCDNNPANGCETNLQTDVLHCGACATACSTVNGTPSCTAGVCSITCNAGFGDCDLSAATGCEVNLNTDPLHCGTCTTACNSTNGTASCAASACGITCNAGFANCDGLLSNGCEVNTTNDPSHCGACGTVCNSTNGTATCAASVCGITCNAGWGNCDGLLSNGCETNLNTDLANCGACGSVCAGTNGTATCTSGTCAIVCNAGWGNCDGLSSNGCETDLTSSVANCGACGSVCNSTNGTASCTASVCGITCNAGWGNCDGLVSNGCETDLTTSPTNCGACGTVCNSTNGTATCAASVCGITCNAGFANCDGLLSNGCEVNTTNDSTNCGTCGTVCSAAAEPNVASVACTASACTITACSAGWYNVDGIYTNGCECQADAVSDVCTSAQAMGSVPIGGTVSYTANITPNTDQDWFTVNLQQACNAHPSVALSDLSGVLRIDVFSACGGTSLGCTDSATGTGLTAWESTSCCTSGPTCTFQSGGPGTLFVRVYAVASSTTCLPYTITFSD